jgi:HAD superfamily hydrolase (TIGR01509 family)
LPFEAPDSPGILGDVSSESNIEAVIFDMDGVLTDSEPLINAAAIAMFREKRIVVQPEDFLPFVGTGEDRYLSGVAEKYAVALDLPQAKKRTYEIYLELVPAKLRAFPGAVELVRACQSAGLKIALASSADLIKINANLNQIGLPPEGWQAIVSGDDVTKKKPAPDIFLAAARKLGVEPAVCTVVEDAVHGVEAAKAAEMWCVAVAQCFPADQLKAADLVRARIADVSLADLTERIPHGTTPFAAAAPPVLPPLLSLGASTSAAMPASGQGPWGFWPTMGFSAIVAGAFVLVQSVVLIVFGLIAFGPQQLPHSIRNLEYNGLFWALATFATTPVVMGLTWLFASVRRRISGLAAKEYLGLNRVSRRTMLWSGLLILLFSLLSDGLTWILGRPTVPEVLVTVYQSAGHPALLWIAILICAPLGEEVFFRGFVIPGVSQSKLGAKGAVVVSAAAWASIHLQYDAHGIALIFVVGLLLGFVRLRTGSIYPCILMHALMNLVATIQTAYVASRAVSEFG